MDLEELRLILIEENNSGSLTLINTDIFNKGARKVADIHQKILENGSNMNESIYLLIEEVHSIRDILGYIFRARAHKILDLAMEYMDSKSLNRDELRKMTPSEREMFESVISAVSLCENEMTGPLAEICSGTQLKIMSIEEESDSGFQTTGDEESAKSQVYRILEDMDPFVGIDGIEYVLSKGDLVTLPVQHGKLLCDRNVALNINLNI